MTARTIARPTNVRTSPPPPPAATCDWSVEGRLRGVDSVLEAARADGAASSMPAQAARKAVVRVGNIEGEATRDEGGGSPVSSAVRDDGLSENAANAVDRVRRARARGIRIEHLSSRLSASAPRPMTQSVSSPHFTFRLERVRSLRERAEDQA